ncbi:MAG: PTS sugar transporter subunit IIB [Clostridiaceae bacterium]
MKKITLMCSGGMSTSLLVKKMRDAAKKLGEEVEIRAVSEGNLEIYDKDTDILLLGPQIRFLLPELKERYSNTDMFVGVIDSIDFGMMDGEKVLKNFLYR